ncbi:MAG: hypothetical protein ABR499_21325 [Gemmatimonadaceae bacterium]
MSAALLLISVAGAAGLGIVQRIRTGPRVPRALVTGRAAAALGDSGAFAMSAAPPSVRPALPLADAESAAVAYAYRFAPTRKVFRAREIVERPSERRSVCGRSYYVRSVVVVPDSVAKIARTTNMVSQWGPAWVVPVCDDFGRALTTVAAGDAPSRLRVVLGDQPGDVPELVFPRNGRWHVSPIPRQLTHGWERGIALLPEAAVMAAAAQLSGTGARVAEVPVAYQIVLSPRELGVGSVAQRPYSQTPACPRWRLTLDRVVTLRGVTSGRIVDTRTVYVARAGSGCSGVPLLQIPQPRQPPTLASWYGVADGPPNPEPLRGACLTVPPPSDTRCTELRVREPVWFEEARHHVRERRRVRSGRRLPAPRPAIATH